MFICVRYDPFSSVAKKERGVFMEDYQKVDYQRY